MKRIEIWTKENCGNCVMVKKLLGSKSIPYIEVDINEFTKPKLLEKNPEAKQAPQIFITTEGVEKNYTVQELISAFKDGELDS